ncbi:MAG: ROK family protein [Enterococcus sp.]
MKLLVFDFGGSAIKYGLWENETLSQANQFPTPDSWPNLKVALKKVQQEIGQAVNGVGISAPGAVNVKKQCIEGISAIPYIHHFDIFSELRALFEVPVAIENDTNCAGLAEFYNGAAKEQTNAAFVVIGSGIGGALFVNGQMNKGAHLYGGEFGLMYLTPTETFSNLGTAVSMAERYCQRAQLPVKSVTGKEVFALAQTGDEYAQQEVERFYRYLAQGLFNIQFSFDPEIIVLGGGVSALPGLISGIKRYLQQFLASHNLQDFVPEIVTCQYQNEANLVGAAANYLLSYPKK